MISRIKLIHFLSNLGALFWVLLGLLTIGGIALSTIGWVINTVVGILFITIGLFFYAHGRAFVRFYQSHTEHGSTEREFSSNPFLKRFMTLEILLLAGNCLVSALLLTAGASRVFGEGFPIFG